MPFLVDSVHDGRSRRHDVDPAPRRPPAAAGAPGRRRRRCAGCSAGGRTALTPRRPTTRSPSRGSTSRSARCPRWQATALRPTCERVLGDVRARGRGLPEDARQGAALADAAGGGRGDRAAADRDSEPGSEAPVGSATGGPKSGGWVIPASPAESPAEIEALLRWLADGHFTFLGYREYDLVDGPDGMAAARGARHRARHPAARQARVERVRRAAARGAGQRPPSRSSLILTKANSRVHRAPAALPGLRRGSSGSARPARSPASSGSSACTPTRPTPRASPGSRCCAASWPRCSAATGIAADSHDGKDLAEFLESYPREELFQIPVAELIPVAERRAAAARPHADPAVPAQGHLRPVHVLPGLHAQGPVHHRGQAARPGDPAQALLGGASVDYSVMVGESAGGPAAHRGAGRAAARRCPTRTRPRWSRQIAAAVRSWDDDLAEEAVGRSASAAAAALLAMCAGAIPDTYKADVPACRGHRRPGRIRRAARVGAGHRVRAVGVRRLRGRRAGRGPRAKEIPRSAARGCGG